MTSADAWPQLDGVSVAADRVMEGTDLSQNTPTWLVPLLSDGRMVAISRFIPIAEGQVKLGEVALLEDPVNPLAGDLGGTLVLFEDVRCRDDVSINCLSNEMRWAVQLPDGGFRLPDGSVVERLPKRHG